MTVKHLGDPQDGIVHIAVDFGFQDRTDIPHALRRASSDDLEGEMDLEHASYLLSRISLRPTKQPGMRTWRKHLFIALAHNATSQTAYLCLPE